MGQEAGRLREEALGRGHSPGSGREAGKVRPRSALSHLTLLHTAWGSGPQTEEATSRAETTYGTRAGQPAFPIRGDRKSPGTSRALTDWSRKVSPAPSVFKTGED